MNPEAWEILNLDPASSIEEVRKRFRKLALKYHPDKGGSPYIFDKIKNAYRDILTFHAGLNQKSFQDLKQQSQEYRNNEQEHTKTYFDPNNLNMDKFNSFFVDHRLNDPLDHGYGHMMTQSTNHREDDSVIAKSKIQRFPDQQLTLYKDPQEVFNCTANVGIIGDDNKNFTAAWNQRVKYTDYMEAHSTPVDRDIIPSRESFNSVDALKASRGKSLRATEKEKRHHQKMLEEQERKERRRMKRTNKTDTQMTSHYQKLQNLLGFR